MFEFLRNLFIFAFIALFIYVIVQLVKSKKISKQVVICRTGSVGSGKSMLNCNDLNKHYKKCLRMFNRNSFFFFRLIKGFTLKYPPKVYSNIPILIKKKFHLFKKNHWEYVYSDVLKREHLLLNEFFDSECTPLVYLDELGLIANQYSYNDLNVISENVNDNYKCLQVFIRFFRHFYGENNHDMCRIFLNDQASGNINISIRRILSSIDNLSGFHRVLGFLPFYKVNVQELLICEDNVQNMNQINNLDTFGSKDFYFGFLPYRWMKLSHYDSHAYCGSKFSGFVGSVSFTNWKDNDYSFIDSNGNLIIDKLKTNYIPDIRMSYEEKIAYKSRLKALGIGKLQER